MRDEAERSCASKKRYPTDEAARSAEIQVWYEHRIVLRFYACVSCDGFHLAESVDDD